VASSPGESPDCLKGESSPAGYLPERAVRVNADEVEYLAAPLLYLVTPAFTSP
jgi:hypothetical protein